MNRTLGRVTTWVWLVGIVAMLACVFVDDRNAQRIVLSVGTLLAAGALTVDGIAIFRAGRRGSDTGDPEDAEV